ncbi:MAG: sugar ABC transporter permease [Eubacteriales bacterium]
MNKKKIYPQWFLIIPLILYGCFFVLPSLLGIFYSFTDWNARSMGQVSFVGLDNYIEIFTSDENYTLGIINTLKFTGISNVLKLVSALFLAILLKDGMKAKGFYRTVMYLPAILPYLVVGLVFKSIFNYNDGLLNAGLEFLQLGFLKQKWLSDINVVWKSIYGVDAWKGIGYVMTIFLAGLSGIPESYYEAASIDGANFWAKLWHITLPNLTGAITINLVFGLAYGLKVFDIVYVLTNGGPGHVTEVVTTYAYQLYAYGQYGMSVALNTILFVFTAIVGISVVKYMGRKEG